MTEKSEISSKLLDSDTKLDSFPSPKVGSQSCLTPFATCIPCNPNIPDRESGICRVVYVFCARVSQP